MEFNSNNNKEEKHVNTRSGKLMNITDHSPCALDVAYYDTAIKLSFTPELPEDQKTEKRTYDYEHQVITMLYRPKAHDLYKAYQEKIVPAIREGRSEQVSVPIANVHQLIIDTNVDSDGVPRPIVKLVKNIDPNTLIADGSNVVYYIFNTGEYILGYDEVTGNYKERVVTYNELELFMRDLDSFEQASSNAYVHTERCVQRFWREQLDEKLVKIGKANGVDLSYKSNNGNAVRGSIFGAKPSENSVQATTVSSLDDLEAELPFN